MCKGRSVSDVLFVCTGNLCRSPAAELLLRQQLAGSGTIDVTVHSAGVAGTDMEPPEALVREARSFELDLEDHVPRKLEPGMVAGADLVIGMSHERVREVVLANPGAFTRTLTLREIVRRGHEQGQRNQERCSVTGWPECTTGDAMLIWSGTRAPTTSPIQWAVRRRTIGACSRTCPR